MKTINYKDRAGAVQKHEICDCKPKTVTETILQLVGRRHKPVKRTFTPLREPSMKVGKLPGLETLCAGCDRPILTPCEACSRPAWNYGRVTQCPHCDFTIEVGGPEPGVQRAALKRDQTFGARVT